MPIPSDWTLQSSKQIASLWSGYGEIIRKTYTTTSQNADKDKDTDVKTSTITTILKRVSAPSKSTYDESHVRKMLSYQIERYFYTHLSPSLKGTKAHIATLYTSTSGESMEMEDLSVHYPKEPRKLNYEETKVVLRSLAAFHATFWASGDKHPTIPCPCPSSLEKDGKKNGIWQEGSYWYLGTRRSEFSQLSEEWKDIAIDVDSKIRAIPLEFRTVIHGDLKCANIMFSRDGDECAFFDLQYVGFGPGVRDLSKFLVSSVDGLERFEEEFLRFYHGELVRLLSERGLGEGYGFEVMVGHYELCFLDYYRFMLGWGFWGDVSFAEKKVKKILKNHKTS